MDPGASFLPLFSAFSYYTLPIWSFLSKYLESVNIAYFTGNTLVLDDADGLE